MAKSILIVDDSSSVRQVVSISLRHAGYEVIEGVDGKDALSKLKGQKVHLIISDVNMPNLDGISLIRELRQLPDYRFVPMLMLTTEAGLDKKQEGKAAGATGWLVKPFNPEQLVGTLRKVLG